MPILKRLLPLVVLLTTFACGQVRCHADDATVGLAQGTRVPVSIANFYAHPGQWHGSEISSGCPSRMYRETTAIAVHGREPREELFQILEATDPLATAVDPWPADEEDRGIRAYALIFHPVSLSARSDDDRSALETQIRTLITEHDISRTGIAVSKSGESRDVDRFRFSPADDVVIVLSERGHVHSTYRFSWDDITEKRIAETISEIQQALDIRE